MLYIAVYIIMQFMGKYIQLLNGLHNKLFEYILLRAWKCEYHCMHLFLIVIIISLLCIGTLALVPDLNYFSFLTYSLISPQRQISAEVLLCRHSFQPDLTRASVCPCHYHGVDFSYFRV